MEAKLKIFLCELFGHKWKYNFPTIPNKRICSRCKEKNLLDLHTLKFNKVDKFENEKRTDDDLIKTWL